MEQAPDTRVGTPHYIYVIHDEGSGAVKIGHAANMKKRLEALQSGNPNKLRIHALYRTEGRGGARGIEAMVHIYLSRSRGIGEWFFATPETAVECIEGRSVALQIPITPVSEIVTIKTRKRCNIPPHMLGAA